MSAIVQFDDGLVLIVTCDHCSEQIAAFGMRDSSRAEVESRIVADGWTFNGGVAWLCKKCGAGIPTAALSDRIAAVSLLKMPD